MGSVQRHVRRQRGDMDGACPVRPDVPRTLFTDGLWLHWLLGGCPALPGPEVLG